MTRSVCVAEPSLSTRRSHWPLKQPSASGRRYKSFMNTDAPPARKGSLIARLIRRWGFEDERDFVLRVVQPGLVGLIDGTVSSIAPIFAAAVSSNSHTAFVVGIAVALGAGISMGVSEALSDTGEKTGRGTPIVRGTITG